jgi:hypothetical protein
LQEFRDHQAARKNVQQADMADAQKPADNTMARWTPKNLAMDLALPPASSRSMNQQ